MHDDELLTLRDVFNGKLKKSLRGGQKDIAAGRFGPDLIRLGRSVRVRASELQRWIAQGCPSREQWLKLQPADRAGVSR
jgi:hypothetical protein